MQTAGREGELRALYGAAMGTRPWPEALDRLAQYTSTRFVSLDFTERELEVLRDLQPDLTQIWLGFKHFSSLQNQLQNLTTLWDRFNHAVVVTNNERRIRFANRAAERLFKAKAILASCAGRLCGACAEVETRLQRACNHLKDEQRQIVSLSPEAANKHDHLTATLFRQDSDRLATILTGPKEPSPDFRAMLQQCYQMTATEADVIQIILLGLSLRDYSDNHKVSYETARTHLKSAMKKNGWRRQGEMIALLLTDLSPVAVLSSGYRAH